jgi:putative sigma-54 modulation protein
MKFKIIGRRYDLTDKIKDYVEKKLGKLDKFFKDESEARVVIGTIKDNDYIEATIYAGGMMYRAEASDKEILAAIDKIVDVIERQIRKNKTRLEKRIKRDATLDNMLISGGAYTEGEETKEFEIVKTKRFIVKPMSSEEAVLQMNLLGHNFFVFKNQETDEMNIVYKRKDGKYAIIESIEDI